MNKSTGFKHLIQALSYENLPAYSFMQVLHYQLDQQCLLWLAENSVNYQGRCSEESMLTPALLHQMELSREPVGLRGNSPTFFYHYHEPALFMRHS